MNVTRSIRSNPAVLLLCGISALMFLIASLAIDGFSSSGSVRSLLLVGTILAVAASGQTLLIISGGIDLSVPGVMTAGALLSATVSGGHNDALVWAIPVVVALALGIGLFNGLGVVLLEVSPIIMTLATNVMIGGVLVVKGDVGVNTDAPRFIDRLAFGELLGLPVPLFILAGVTLAMTILLTLTPFGRRVYAVGTSPVAARFSGVSPARVTVAAYMLSALGSCLAGILLFGFAGRAFLGMADEYQFSVITVVIVGGTSILGGSGHYLGTVVAVVLLTVMEALLDVLNLGGGAISIFSGVVILLSVWLARQDLASVLRRSQLARIVGSGARRPRPAGGIR